MDGLTFLAVMIPIWVAVFYIIFFSGEDEKKVVTISGETKELPKTCPVCKTGTLVDLTPYIPTGTYKCNFCNYIQYDMRWNDGKNLHSGH